MRRRRYCVASKLSQHHHYQSPPAVSISHLPFFTCSHQLPERVQLTLYGFRIPDDTGEPPDGEAVNAVVKIKIECMKHLTANGCPSAPRLIAYSKMKQPEGMCLPGGYLVCILMEMLPGKMIMVFWDYNRATRDLIRKAFKKSWLCVSICICLFLHLFATSY